VSEHTAEKDARALLARADEQKRIARWAETMRSTIRLGRPIKLSEMHQRGPFGRRRKYLYDLDDRMPRPAVDALYRALWIVATEAEANAKALEERVTATATQPGSTEGDES